MAIHPLIREFEVHVEKNRETGLNCAGQSALYVPHCVWREFWTLPRIRTLRAHAGIITAPSNIRDHYLLGFSLLAMASRTVDGSLDFFDNLVSHQREDSTLPWSECPEALKDGQFEEGRAKPVWKALSQLQWSFCPVLLKLRHPLSDTRLDQRSIFAFDDRKQLGSSHLNQESKVYSVAVNKRAHKHLPDADQIPNRVVFKAYRAAYQELYDKERRAYAALSPRSRNILRCLGSFYWLSANRVRTSTLLLEYADGGTLLDLFQGGNVPWDISGIKAIWEALDDMVAGLEAIHQQAGLKAIHQDLKPSNILVFLPRDTPGSFAFTFKISDFGSCYIPSERESHNRNDAVYSRTTRTYSAPELQLGEDIIYIVDSAMDMWSIGCVLVEAAVWISLGERGRQDFLDERKRETTPLTNQVNRGLGDCFHDGNEVLKSVKAVADRIKHSGRSGDNISVEVVELALDYLLVKKNWRLTASQFHARLGRAIHNSQLTNEDPISPGQESVATRDASASPLSMGCQKLFMSQERRISDITSPPMSTSPPTTTTATSHQVVLPERPLSIAPPTPAIQAPEPQSRRISYPPLSIESLIIWRRSLARAPSMLSGWMQAKPMLENRDYIFIVDNSTSMQQYRDEVLRVVPCLGYLVKHFDPNGLQLLMTSHPHDMVTCQNSTSMKDFINSKFRSGPTPCQIEHALEQALDGVYRSIPQLATSNRRGSVSNFSSLWRRVKPFSILVFTDGVWDDSDHGVSGADHPIERCIARMKEHGVARTKVAIQFVQFGASAKGNRRLTFLDDGLALRPQNSGYDIVDHKSLQDSVWDILIGSLSLVIDGHNINNGVSAGGEASSP